MYKNPLPMFEITKSFYTASHTCAPNAFCPSTRSMVYALCYPANPSRLLLNS